MKDLAYYVFLTKQYDSSIPNLLISGKIPEEKFKSIVSKNIPQIIASLHFNVEEDKAQELLLLEPIRNALEKSNSAELDRLSKGVNGFWEIFLRLFPIASHRKDAAIERLSNAINCFTNSQLVKLDHINARLAKQRLIEAVESVGSWSPISAQVNKALVSSLKVYPSMLFCKKMITGLFSEPINSNSSDDLKLKAKTLFDLLHTADAANVLKLDEVQLHLQYASIDALLEFLIYFDEFDKKDEYGTVFAFDDITKNMTRTKFILQISEGKFSDDLLRCLPIGMNSGLLDELDDIFSAVSIRIDESIDFSGTELVALLRFYWMTKNSFRLHTDVAKPGKLIKLLSSMFQKDEKECVLWLIASYLWIYKINHIDLAAKLDVDNPYTIIANKIVPSKQNEEFIDSLIAIFVEYQFYQEFWTELDFEQSSIKEYAIYSLRRIAPTKHLKEFFDPIHVVRHWALLKTMFNEDSIVSYSEVVTRIVQETKLCQYIMKNVSIDQEDLLFVVLNHGGSDQPEYRKWLSVQLGTVAKETWLDSIKQSSQLIDLAIVCIEKGSTEYPNLTDAIKEAAAYVAFDEDSDASAISIINLKNVLNLKTTSFQRDVRDILVNNPDKQARSEFYELFFSDIVELPVLFERPLDAVRVIFQKVVAERNIGGLKWLLSVGKPLVDDLDKFDAEEIDSFISQIENCLTADITDDATEILEQLNELMPSRPTSKETEEKGPDDSIEE